MDIISVLDTSKTGPGIALDRWALRLLEHGPGCLALLAGSEFNCVHANAGFLRFAEGRRLIGADFFNVFPELEGQGVRALFDRVATHRRPWAGQGRRIALQLGGESVWRTLDVALQPVPTALETGPGLLLHVSPSPSLPGRDPLTGLVDDARFRSALEHILAAAPAQGGGMIVALDVDRFHRVNAAIGRVAGDLVLRELGVRLRGASMPDLAARVGPSRFLFLTDGDASTNADVPARLLDTLAAPFHHDGLAVHLNGFAGVARFPEHGATADALMASVDHALAEARRAGPGAIREGVYVGGRERDEARMSAALRSALDDGGIEVHYQPQVDLDSGRICGVEALVRWTHPESGPVPPTRIIQLAEDAGLIDRLGDLVLRIACAQGLAWRNMGFGALRIAVNLSARQVRMHSFEPMVLDALAQTGLPPSCLELELTESVVMDDVEHAVACFESLKRHGVQLSLDDFGTGYSSLAYLRLFPVDALKIDRSFLERVPADARAAGLVDAIVAVAHGLGIRVVAEGVENEAQLRFLMAGRCDEMQGYYFSKPVSNERMTAILLAQQALSPELRRSPPVGLRG